MLSPSWQSFSMASASAMTIEVPPPPLALVSTSSIRDTAWGDQFSLLRLCWLDLTSNRLYDAGEHVEDDF
jgi:hypothetical protein